MHLDKTVHAAKLPFLKLHELGHGLLPWQRDIYALTADCKQTLDPEVNDLFERETNAFASEVLFQVDTFTNEAADHPFSIKTPMKLSKKYGASVYSTVRHTCEQTPARAPWSYLSRRIW
ncbi:MAG: ImmA/IrrE family metallo-endopeptidase [Phycisphaerales bacterium]